MALIAFPMQSNFTGYDEYENPLFDRAVDSLFYRTFWMKYFTDGIFFEPADNFKASAAGGMKISVKLGECHIRGLTASADEDTVEIITLDPPEPLVDRTDRIVIRADVAENRAVTIEVRKDWKPSDSLTRNSNIWELAIADVLVKKGTATISAAYITDLRLNTSLCGIVTEPIKRTNTQVFFEQLAAAMADINNEWNEQKDFQNMSFFQQLSSQAEAFDGFSNTVMEWYALVHADIHKLQVFDFDNISGLLGCTKTSTISGNRVTELVQITGTGKHVAKRETINETNKLITGVTVYDDDGVSILKNTVLTATFLPDGTIKEVIV